MAAFMPVGQCPEPPPRTQRFADMRPVQKCFKKIPKSCKKAPGHLTKPQEPFKDGQNGRPKEAL